MKKDRSVSKVLGILSIVLGVFIPIIGLVLGIVGLCVRKSELHYGRDVVLSVVGIVVSLLSWIVAFLALSLMLGF